MIIQQPLIVECDIKGCSLRAAIETPPHVDKKIPVGWNFYRHFDGKSLETKHVCLKHDLFKGGGTLNGS